MDLITFVGTADLERATAFYRDVLGLRLVERNEFASVFDVNGTMLRVTTVEEVSPRPYTVLGWAVEDVVAAIGELEERRVAFLRFGGMGQDDRGIWTAPGGVRVAWFRDPDGNVLSLSQHS